MRHPLHPLATYCPITDMSTEYSQIPTDGDAIIMLNYLPCYNPEAIPAYDTYEEAKLVVSGNRT
jgi:hypothetical protein